MKKEEMIGVFPSLFHGKRLLKEVQPINFSFQKSDEQKQVRNGK